ncbi:MAG: glycosyltransferase [Myxococcales bacterium]|nr:glycosyltransferase [Myxococcales bacterium]
MAGAETEVLVDVVIVARDCARALKMTLERVPRRGIRSVVVVDNGSTDNSGQVARDLGAIVLRAHRGGYGNACRRAIRHLHALPNRPGVVVFIDPLGPEDPAGLPLLLAPLRTETAELVLSTDVEKHSDSGLRERAMLGLIGVLYGHNFSELSGFRAVKYPALVALGMSAEGDGWDVEMLVKAVRLGLHISEVPIARAHETGEGCQRRRGTGRKLMRILRHAAAR